MKQVITRRNFLAGASAASVVGLAGCSQPHPAQLMDVTDLSRPLLVFDQAVPRPKNRNSLIHHLDFEKLEHFDSIFFVNKSAFGPYSQTMKMLQREVHGEGTTIWRVKRTFQISTGREKQERYFTTTPRGIFTVNPRRRHEEYASVQWDGTEMPHAQFWDYIYPNGRPTGIAFHAANKQTEPFLGIRASGGCVRFSRREARELFDIVADHAGTVPVFKRSDPRGLLQYENGRLKTKQGFKALIVVEDNKNIDWDPFVGDERWERISQRNDRFKPKVDHQILVDASQN